MCLRPSVTPGSLIGGFCLLGKAFYMLNLNLIDPKCNVTCSFLSEIHSGPLLELGFYPWGFLSTEILLYYAYIRSLLANNSGHFVLHVNEAQKHIALQRQSNTLLKSVSNVIPEALTSHLSQEAPWVLRIRRWISRLQGVFGRFSQF